MSGRARETQLSKELSLQKQMMVELQKKMKEQMQKVVKENQDKQKIAMDQ
eukprot:CAMPEP_0116878658 /NCGR_PEP_ID=MMETSP0463-20121206/10409_1 /TAXON_ID=181622 /ORGANISM="Strombidinopsis sp, Strain SopsisLIS2011" /LENGTH=49 /DNA_ID=CAMNT_0004527101 /DNA_START=1415 /DNA_END=1564 /DNA_ORIENTATION=-